MDWGEARDMGMGQAGLTKAASYRQRDSQSLRLKSLGALADQRRIVLTTLFR